MGLSDWLAVTFSAAALGGVIWQILRHEGGQPLEGWHMNAKVTTEGKNPRRLARVTIRPIGPAVRYEVRWHVVGASVVAPAPSDLVPYMDARSEPIELRLYLDPGEVSYVQVRWVTFSKVMRRPVERARRLYLAPNLDLKMWAWSRLGLKRGKWVRVARQARRGAIPESESQ